jgi:hypothetical protein
MMKTVLLFALAMMSSRNATPASLCVTVMDVMRLPLPRATVTVANLVSRKSVTIKTNQEGLFCSSDLAEGQYSIEASMSGFMNVRYTPVSLSYPNTVRIVFWLPLADIEEGGFGTDAVLSGTLGTAEGPNSGAEICLIGPTLSEPICTRTNDLGEYALTVPPGKYEATVRTRGGVPKSTPLDLPSSGVYRNRL